MVGMSGEVDEFLSPKQTNTMLYIVVPRRNRGHCQLDLSGRNSMLGSRWVYTCIHIALSDGNLCFTCAKAPNRYLTAWWVRDLLCLQKSPQKHCFPKEALHTLGTNHRAKGQQVMSYSVVCMFTQLSFYQGGNIGLPRRQTSPYRISLLPMGFILISKLN